MRRFIKSLFYIPKHAKQKDDNIIRMIMPSVIGIILCMSCLAGLTWAWFTTTIDVKPQQLTSASFNLDVKVIKDGVALDADTDNQYSLKAGEEYAVTLTALDSTTSGYCEVSAGDKKYYTAPIESESFEFTITPQSDVKYKFSAIWGALANDKQPDIENGDSIN